MKRLSIILLSLCFGLGLWAQGGADRIVGTYLAKLSRNDAKVKAFKYQGGYRMQICWLKETKHPDGTLKVDAKNPDASKRSTPMSQVVLVDKVTYEDGIWQNGRIYDPTSGKTYKVELSLDGKTLQVKGKLGPFSKSMYWTKIE
jgi:uncharacterized protein (DUF2147 family)